MDPVLNAPMDVEDVEYYVIVEDIKELGVLGVLTAGDQRRNVEIGVRRRRRGLCVNIIENIVRCCRI